MSESTKERLAKLIIAAERKHEETDEQDRLLDIADALLAAGVTLPEPEPEWRVRKGTSRARWFVDRWDGQNEHILFFGPTAEADAREYVARKLAKPLDVEALADTCRAALGIKDSVRTLLPEGRTNWCNGIRRVLELAQVGAVARPLPSREELANVVRDVWYTTPERLADAVLALLNERAK